MPWSKTPLPRIKPAEKINYVNINWWDNFSDDYLKCYIIKAIEYNHDAKQASWAVEEYKQQVKLQFSNELPSLSGGGSYVLNHLQDVFRGTKNNIFAVPFVASYEADIFLKNHDKTKSSKKAYEVSKFQEQSIYISLTADVVGGIIAGVLHAPKSGEESRKELKEVISDLAEKHSPEIKEAKKQALESIDLVKYKAERQLRKLNHMLKSRKMQKAKELEDTEYDFN